MGSGIFGLTDGIGQIYVEISSGTFVSNGNITKLESIDKWVRDTLIWAVELQDRAEKYHRSLIEASVKTETSFLQIKEARKRFQPTWLAVMEEEIRALASTCSTTDEGGPTIDQIEDKFYEIKPILETIDLNIDAIRRKQILCVCETNETMHCPIHEARKFAKNMHGIDGSMGAFDTI